MAETRSDPYTNPGGWGKPALAHKWHWFNQGMSLCGGWYFSGNNEDRGQANKQCCVNCARKLVIKNDKGFRSE